MAISVRAAQPDEYPIVRDILSRAFATDDEAQLWDYIVAHDTRLRPQDVRVAALDGRPIACTVALPCQVRIRQGWAPGAIITLVACHPDYQRQGYGGSTVHDALAYLAAEGLAVGLLYGHPSYYPRFGFVPVLPAWQTTLAVVDLPGDSAVALAPAGAGDVATLNALYAEQMGAYPCAVARTSAPWEWQPRHPERDAVLLLASDQGYAFVGGEPEQGTLVVYEAAARDDPEGLLRGLAREAGRRGLAQVRLRMPPDHPLVRAAVAHGAAQSTRPPAAGMAAITRWDLLLPPTYHLKGEGLTRAGRLVVRAGPRPLTELALGARGIDDLLRTPDCLLAGDATDLAQLRHDFPAGFPRWSLAPFWF